MKSRIIKLAVIMAAATLAADGAWANNLAITNLTIKPRDDSTAYVKFDIQWENSWRYTNINHDAAWVFFKVKPEGRTEWEHVTLETNGHVTGTGTPINIIVPADQVGCFIRRDAEGAGTLSVTNVKVAWNFVSNNLVMTDRVRLQAFAVEMVYVAEGEFAAGSGGTGASEFMLTTINTNDASVAPSGSGSLGGEAGGYPTSQTAPISSWPNGYSAFYCMKYEITQGQYRDFLNSLTRAQQNSRTATQLADYFAMSGGIGISYRNGIRCPSSVPLAPEVIVFGCDGNNNKVFNQTNDAMDRACNYLDWMHGSALADWAGLRPFTELEYEKACRGPLAPVADEYAWGDVTIVQQTGHSGTDGSGMETATPIGANCCYDNKMGGPVRVGIYTTASSTRQMAGASYWGIMDLSGNLAEWAVTIGNAAGRLFTGVHGDGTLSASGNANVTNWPGITAGEVTGRTGAGLRDSGFFFEKERARVSDRTAAISGSSDSFYRYGWRAVRTAPAGVGP